MGPADLGTSISFRVAIDGEPPRNAYGSDVDGSGRGVLVQRQMYQSIRQQERQSMIGSSRSSSSIATLRRSCSPSGDR
jgi:hypothetical protein